MATRVVRKEQKRREEERREESTLGVLCALLGAVYVYVCVCVCVCVCDGRCVGERRAAY